MNPLLARVLVRIVGITSIPFIALKVGNLLGYTAYLVGNEELMCCLLGAVIWAASEISWRKEADS